MDFNYYIVNKQVHWIPNIGINTTILPHVCCDMIMIMNKIEYNLRII